MPSPAQIFKIQLKAFRNTLHKASEDSKKNHVAVPTAEEFNKVLVAVATEFPDLKGALPSPIDTKNTTQALIMGVTTLSFLDLEIMVETVLSLIDAMESEK